MAAGRRRAALLAAAMCLGLGAAPAIAQDGVRACDALPDWTTRMTCRSTVLKELDGERRAATGRVAALGGRALGRVLTADRLRWSRGLASCRTAPYPQQCLERRHYRRIDWLELLAHTLTRGVPSHDPVMACRRRSETRKQLDQCLQETLDDLSAANRLFAAAQGTDAAGPDRPAQCTAERLVDSSGRQDGIAASVCAIEAARGALARHLMRSRAARP